MEITMEMVKKLRDETHAGIMDCKKALSESNGDFAAASKYLKEVGLAAVEKRADRATDNGRIAFGIGKDMAVIFNITCETDFVARNENFAKLGNDLCDYALKNHSTAVDEKMDSMVKDLIATIHENMAIKSMDTLSIADNEFVQGYSHQDGNIGVLVEFAADKKEILASEAFKTLAFNTSLHICAADPMYMDANSVPKEYENEQLEIFMGQVAKDEKLASKPDQVKQGIVRGKLSKHYSEICLMSQVCQVYNDDGLTMQQIIDKFNKDNGCKVTLKAYKRLRAGA